MKVVILGAGNGGCAAAVDLSLRGFDVTLCSAYSPEHILPIRNKCGLEYSGILGEGFVNFGITIDINETVQDAAVIFIMVPAPIQETYASILAPLIATRQRVPIVLSGSSTGGALHFCNILKQMGVSEPIIGETDILPYAARLVSQTHVKIFHKVKWRQLSCFPSKHSGEIYDHIRSLYPELDLVDNVLQTSLSNVNAILHPPGMILNAGWIESTDGDFLFYSQGITSAVSQVIQEIDSERVRIMEKADLRPMGIVELLYRYGFSSADANASVLDSIRSSTAISKIRSPVTLDHRYLLEDVGYGLVPMSLIGHQIFGIETRNIDSIINLACILNKIDHWQKGMTLEKLGLKGARPDVIERYLKGGNVVD